MFAYPLRAAALAATAAITLSGCAYNGLYSGVSVGYGNAGYYDPYYGYGYGYPGYGYSRLGYGYSPYWGWHDSFYYPGSGFYVYDRYRRPYRWTDAQRRYWTIRRERALATSTTSQPVVIRDNWGDFDRSTVRRERIQRSVDRPIRVERSVDRPTRAERIQARVERNAARAERSVAREQRKSEIRAERTSRSNSRSRDGSQED